MSGGANGHPTLKARLNNSISSSDPEHRIYCISSGNSYSSLLEFIIKELKIVDEEIQKISDRLRGNKKVLYKKLLFCKGVWITFLLKNDTVPSTRELIDNTKQFYGIPIIDYISGQIYDSVDDFIFKNHLQNTRSNRAAITGSITESKSYKKTYDLAYVFPGEYSRPPRVSEVIVCGSNRYVSMRQAAIGEFSDINENTATGGIMRAIKTGKPYKEETV